MKTRFYSTTKFSNRLQAVPAMSPWSISPWNVSCTGTAKQMSPCYQIMGYNFTRLDLDSTSIFTTIIRSNRIDLTWECIGIVSRRQHQRQIGHGFWLRAERNFCEWKDRNNLICGRDRSLFALFFFPFSFLGLAINHVSICVASYSLNTGLWCAGPCTK